jgi:hypothetical protein
VGREWETSSSLERATGGEFIGGEKARLISSMEVKNPPEQILRKKNTYPPPVAQDLVEAPVCQSHYPMTQGKFHILPGLAYFPLCCLGHTGR